MAHLDLEEQEQLAQLKSWWATYGSFLVTLLVGAALGFSAWQGWRYWQGSQSANASALFETLTKGLQAADAKAVRDSSGELLEKYAGTQYAAMGALSSARFFFDKGDLKAAKAQLQWVIDKSGSEEFRDLARLRLANVLLDENGHDAALKLLEQKHGEAFDAQYVLLRGDTLVSKRQTAEAKAAYKLALDKTDKKNTQLRDSIQMRIDALGG